MQRFFFYLQRQLSAVRARPFDLQTVVKRFRKLVYSHFLYHFQRIRFIPAVFAHRSVGYALTIRHGPVMTKRKNVRHVHTCEYDRIFSGRLSSTFRFLLFPATGTPVRISARCHDMLCLPCPRNPLSRQKGSFPDPFAIALLKNFFPFYGIFP